MSRVLAVWTAILIAFPAAVILPAVAEAETPSAAVNIAGKCKTDSGKGCKPKYKYKYHKGDFKNLSNEDATALAAVSEVLVVVALAALI